MQIGGKEWAQGVGAGHGSKARVPDFPEVGNVPRLIVEPSGSPSSSPSNSVEPPVTVA